MARDIKEPPDLWKLGGPILDAPPQSHRFHVRLPLLATVPLSPTKQPGKREGAPRFAQRTRTRKCVGS